MSQHTELWKTLRMALILVAVVLLGWIGFRLVEKTLAGTASGFDRGLDRVLAALTHSDTRIIAGRADLVAAASMALRRSSRGMACSSRASVSASAR